MKQVGRKGKLWLKTRREWLRENPPNFQGYYVCHICGTWVHEKGMELDHVIPRSRKPDGLTDFENLKPSHSLCNSNKGSKIL